MLQRLDGARGDTKHGFMRCFRPGGREGLCPIHSSECGSQCCVCPSPAARQGLFSFPLLLSCSSEVSLIYTNLEVMQPRPLIRASCRCSSFFRLCKRLSGFPCVRSGMMSLCICFCRKDDKDYALKQIEGTGISMSACREIAVRTVWFCPSPPTPV